MPPQSNAILIVGSGPGIGRNTAAVFAEKGFRHVILMSRDAGRLAEDAAFVKEKAAGQGLSPRIDTVPVDLSNLDAVREALADVERKLEDSKVPLQVVHHNAARVGPSKLGTFPVEELEKDLKIAVSSMYLIAQWSTPKLLQLAQPNSTTTAPNPSKPAFLVTSGLLYTDPFPHLISLSAAKAAQHNVVHSLHKHYAPKGVHFGLVVVGGFVSDEAELTTARKVAEEFYRLWEQPGGEFELEKTMVDPGYEAVMRKRVEDGAKD